MLAEIWAMAGTAVGSGTISAVLTSIIFRKQNKKLKNDEVQKAETETDRQQIDLGDLFLEKTQKWAEILESNSTKVMEKIDENNRKRDHDFEDMKSDIEFVKKAVTGIKDEQEIVIAFLDGEYDAFKKMWKNKIANIVS